MGALATLIDDVGAAAIFSLSGHIKASLDFSISFYSTAKIHVISSLHLFFLVFCDLGFLDL